MFTREEDAEVHRHIQRRSRSRIEGGGDTTIPSPGRSPKQALPGIGLHDPLHGRQTCRNSTHFSRGLVKYVSGRGYFRVIPSQNGDTLLTSPPPIVERLVEAAGQVYNQTNEYVYLGGNVNHNADLSIEATGAYATHGAASGSTPSNCTTDRALPSSSKYKC